MSVPFKYKGNQLRVASSWEDLTLGQTIDILNWAESKDQDFGVLASIISGIEHSELINSPVNEVNRIASVGYHFITKETPSPEHWQAPAQFILNGKVYNREFDAGELSYGCMSIFEATISRDDIRFAEKIPMMIASVIYKGSFKNGESEAKKEIEDLANNHIMHMKFIEAQPLASFFLTKYELSLKDQERTITATHHLKKGRTFGNWKSLVSSVRSILYRAAIRYNSRRS